MSQQVTRSVTIRKPQRSLYGDMTNGGSLHEAILRKEIPPGNDGKSAQGANTGTRAHLYDLSMLQALKEFNEHHATCIHAKVSATVGLGFLNETEKQEQQNGPTPSPVQAPQPDENGDAPEQPQQAIVPLYSPAKADEVLDPLTTISWHDTMMDVCENFFETGNGYLEVVRSGQEIVGIHHLPSKDVRIVVDDNEGNFHYAVTGEGSVGHSADRHFAVFGDKQDFIDRVSQKSVTFSGTSVNANEPDSVSEVIHFRKPSSKSKWYGAPDWISAVPMIELAQMLHQYKFDFFNNRGVPEFMLFVTGGKVSDKDWANIVDAMKANIGLGNSHKSVAVNIPLKDIEIQVEKLAMETSKDEDFKMLKETIALSVVTAHKVPPLLAGIQIPGKLGATNELSQALIAFQSLVIGQAQRLFQSTLARTLAGDNGVKSLTGEDFTFKTITDDLDPSKMSAIGRMHQPLPEANAEGRDPEDGMRD